MAAFFSRPDLEPGEQILLEPAANRSVANRGIGGRLYVTDRRLIFTPSKLYRVTKQVPWICPHPEVVAMGEAGQMLDEVFSGGLRKRLLVRSADGRQELFVINHLEKLLPSITDAVVAGGGTAS